MSISGLGYIPDVECPDCGNWPHEGHKTDCKSVAQAEEVKKFHDGNLPDSFFDRSEPYRRIKYWADENFCNPTATLHIVLTRIAGAIHPQTVIQRIPGAAPETCLSLFTGILGRPGDGKSKTGRIARDLVALPDTCGVEAPGSGAGLAACFAVKQSEKTGVSGMKPPPEPPKYNGLALYIDEGETLLATASRQGEDLTPTLCSAFVAEDLSKSLAGDSRIVVPGSYTLGMAIGMQPQVLNKLAATQGIGLIQRFLFAPGSPQQTKQFDEYGWKREELVAPKPIPLNVGVNVPVKLAREDVVTSELYRMLVNPADRNERADIDCHHPMVLHKVAGLIAIMHGERTVTQNHLIDAIDIVDASMDYRDQWLDDIETGDDVKREHEAALQWVADKCAEYPRTRRQLTDGYPKRFRKIYKQAEAIDTAVAMGLIFRKDDKKYYPTTSKG